MSVAERIEERERVKKLVDLVPDSDLDAAARMLRGLAVDPVAWTLDNAPLDDEPITQEDIDAQAEARADIAAGRVYSHEDVVRRLGLARREGEAGQ